MSITIRNATLDDVPAIARLTVDIHVIHVAAQPDRYKPMTADTPALLEINRKRIETPDTTVLVAVDDQMVIGHLTAMRVEITENPFVFSGVDFHIDQMGVTPTRRGQGVGSLLMDRALEIGRNLGANTVSLGVAAFNEDARRFYERYGFRVRSYRMGREM
jgi:ribosomal protein S18 acetylase RimI-like enzyme